MKPFEEILQEMFEIHQHTNAIPQVIMLGDYVYDGQTERWYDSREYSRMLAKRVEETIARAEEILGK